MKTIDRTSGLHELPILSDTMLAAIERYSDTCLREYTDLLFASIDDFRDALSDLSRKPHLEPQDLGVLETLIDDIENGLTLIIPH